MTKVVISGATGFVGSRLCDVLDQQGMDVHKIKRTTHGNEKEILINGIDGKTNWDGCFEGIDHVFHLAAHVHQMGKIDDAGRQKFYDVNFEGTRQMAEAAALQGVKHFLFLSSSKVYGEHSEKHGPFKESDPCNPVDDYGKSKLMAEEALKDIAKSHDMAITIIRIPLVYGPGVKANFLALIKLCEKLPLLPFGGLKNKRDMVYLDNLVHALATCAERAEKRMKIYNVADPNTGNMSEFIDHLCEEFDKKNKNLTIPTVLMDLCSNLPIIGRKLDKIVKAAEIDCTLIRDELEWSAPEDLNQALSKTVKWYKTHHTQRPK